MAALTFRRMKSEFEANNFVQGGIRLPLAFKGNERVFGLHGLTLVFTAPVGKVTFADAAGEGLLVKDIIDQINGDVAALRAELRDGVLYVRQVTPTASVVLDGAASTARPVLRLKNGNISGKFYNPPNGVAPRLVSFADTGVMDGFTLLTEE